jgi:thermostable 8-oxoguanine DNA glycosylase
MMKAMDCNRDLSDFLDDYRYQPKLTESLDAVDQEPFGQTLIDKIVLWKVNRYAPLSPKALEELNSVVHLESGSHKSAYNVIAALLKEPGVDLPMASTFLRFRNPRTFQIIDRHAYRAASGENYPLFSGSRDEAKIELYFRYLDDLVEIARAKNLEFRTLDRVLYVFDKQTNGKL